ncbi:MAG: (deoxy)nucleoside triphosphate pyrophosphohydrolase [Bacillota bacterium]|nr:(deoxy)nucleoside triphosphate pyrophosphohydrolase [Bacillota bacterium]HHT91046.1 (deoxy)nucleoside triphosphate pyrophosphohydrolase [Bacillota bacterium]
MKMPLPVMAAIIQQGDQVLLCQRKEGALAGKWEFPGGKIEDGETPEECLVREIREELGITIEVDHIFQAVHSHYEHGDFLVIGYLAKHVAGEISLRVHSDCKWVELDKLDNFDLADANIPIAKSLKEKGNSAGSSVGPNGGSD